MTPAPATTEKPSTEATLAQWIQAREALEARMRETGVKPGLADPSQVAGLSGLALMSAMLDGRLPPPPIAETLDFVLIEVAKGRAVFQGAPKFAFYNPLGTVHGGWYATLLDSALGCAVHTSLEAGQAYTTAELSVNIVRAASANTGPLRAIGEVIHVGRQMATAQARIVGPDGRLYAHGTTTCLVLAPRG